MDRVGAALFEVFFPRFCRAVADERSPPDQADLVAGAIAGLAAGLLAEDKLGWFGRRSRDAALLGAFEATLAELEGRLGPDMATWTWGRLHQIRLPHILAARGELGQLLDRGGLPGKGNGVTVCNTGYDPNYLAPMVANYRLIPPTWGRQRSRASCRPWPSMDRSRHRSIPSPTALLHCSVRCVTVSRWFRRIHVRRTYTTAVLTYQRTGRGPGEKCPCRLIALGH